MSEWHSKPITSTGYDAQMCGEDGYEIHFYTDKKEAYLAVQDMCRQFIGRKTQTNADRIRSMTNEELCDFLHDMKAISEEVNLSEEWWKNWLNAEVSE